MMINPKQKGNVHKVPRDHNTNSWPPLPTFVATRSPFTLVRAVRKYPATACQPPNKWTSVLRIWPLAQYIRMRRGISIGE